MKKIVVATKNKGKTAEINDRIAKLGIRVTSLLDEKTQIEIIEDADTFAGNAIKKATEVSKAFNCPALADDSGLEVDALDGRPGIYSARYGGEGLDDKGRYEHLLAELKDTDWDNRKARFRCVLAFVRPGKEPVVFDGTLEGKIALEPQGSEGFGYDPVFIPEGHDQTVAQLGPQIKSKISHRAKSLDQFTKWLKTNPE